MPQPPRRPEFRFALAPPPRYKSFMPVPAAHEPKPDAPESATARRARTTLWMMVLFIVALNGTLVFKTCVSTPERVIDKAGQWLTNVAGAFNQGRITTEFLSYATTVEGSHRLQFATLKQKEIFTRTDEATTAFGYVPLPDLLVEARAPVEYTYYLDLKEPWKLVLQDGVLRVYAPAIRFNTPAVDASAITYEVRKDSVLRNTSAAVEALKKSITPLTQQRAQENVQLIRETGRRQVEAFVEKWLARTFADGGKAAVKVYFPDESPVLELRAAPPAR